MSIPTLFDQTGILIRRFDFSEPQAGKSACDRMSATIKGNIRRYVNEGNDCENSQQFVQAAKSTLFTNVIASRLSSYNMPEHKLQWHGIKKFNNILYEINNESRGHRPSTTTNNSSIRARVWRAYGIGAGKKYDLEEKPIDIDPIEMIIEHTDNEWKFDGFPGVNKSIYRFFNLLRSRRLEFEEL